MISRKYFSLFLLLLGFSSLMLAQHARLDVADPLSWGRDQGTIEEASGGFLHVSVSREGAKATAAFRFHDEHGELLYEALKTARLDTVQE